VKNQIFSLHGEITLFLIALILSLAAFGGSFNTQQHQFALAAEDSSISSGDSNDSTNQNSDTTDVFQELSPSRNDFAITQENSIVTINVLANDNDHDNQFLSITNVSKPVFGITHANNDGTITYVPYQMKLPGDAVLFDSFTYTAQQSQNRFGPPVDSNSYEATVTVKIVQQNDPPIAYDAQYENQKNSQLSFYLQGYDEDGDGISFIMISNASLGRVDFDPVTGKVDYDPYFDNINDDEIIYAVSDGFTTSQPASIKITTIEGPEETLPGAASGGNNNSPSPPPPPDPCGQNTSTCNTNGGSSGNNTGTGTGGNSTSGSVQHKPVADAGPSFTLFSSENAVLDGTGSSDQDGDLLSYRWSQISGPTVSLSNAQTAHPSFTAPAVSALTTLKFRLIVNDGHTDSLPSTVIVTVVPRPDIKIDILPGVYPNVIYKNRPNEVIPVAILGSSSLSVSDINLSNLRFGPYSAIAKSTEYKDVDGDGHTDLVGNYRVGDAGLGASSTKACIVGTVSDNSSGADVSFKACDSVVMTNAPR